MKFLQAGKIFLRRLLGRQLPFSVKLTLSESRIQYLSKPGSISERIPVNIFLDVIPELKKLGVFKVILEGLSEIPVSESGPLLQELIKNGITITATSYGCLLDSLGELRNKLDHVNFLLDGTEEVNDRLFFPGSFSGIIREMETCDTEGIRFHITTTLNRLNINRLTEIVDLAGIYGTFVGFQPLKHHGITFLRELEPAKAEFKNALDQLMMMKTTARSGFIRNSLTGLLHIYSSPDFGKLSCSAGKLFFSIRSDGKITPCEFSDQSPSDLPSITEQDWVKKIAGLSDMNEYCNGCGFCGELETNLFHNGKYLPLLHLGKL
ncbi:MAG: hypothetical protein PHW04_04960 [Candidatus Wallbacteria bacterium]|nr:hypothetical protein [Candidatus Wallbacteria bacterium]